MTSGESSNHLELLLCTDLDRTLLPNGSQSESQGARDLFAHLVSHPQLGLAYVTGRDKGLVAEAIEHYRLPRPDYVISDVGTTIYQCSDTQWQMDGRWQDKIALDWRGLNQPQMAELLDGIAGLEPQESAKQGRFKLSYYHPLEIDRAGAEQQLQERLHGAALGASLIWSIDEPASLGLLDVVPQSAGKLYAVDYLRGKLGLEEGAVLFAGDSGNDIELLCSGYPAVLVANASSEVVEQIRCHNQESSPKPYRAGGGYLGMNGNYSAGILEGVAHFFPKWGRWIRQYRKGSRV